MGFGLAVRLVLSNHSQELDLDSLQRSQRVECLSAMRFAFRTTPAGYVEVAQSDDMSVFIRVLNDCVGSRAPRGARSGPSTYWIDAALEEFRRALSDSDSPSMLSGNMSYLQLVDGLVEARYDYDPPDSDIVERLPLPDVIALLEQWRTAVINLDPNATTRLPPTRPAIELGPPHRESASLRSRFEGHAAALSDRTSLDVSEKDGATTLRLRPDNFGSASVVLYLYAERHGTVALDDPAGVPAELGDDSTVDLEAIDYMVSVAREGRATAFRLGRGGCMDIRDGQQTSRSWHNAWPWPGWRRRAERVEYEPYS